MNPLKSVFEQAPSVHSDVRYRRLLFWSWHRGTQESDLILGPFAELCLPGFNAAQFDRFEALLGCTDPDLFDWIIAGIAPPPQHDHDVMWMLRNFRIGQTQPPTTNAH